MLTGPMYKLIKLSNSRGFTAVDVSDFEWLSHFKWSARVATNGQTYAYTMLRNGPESMQRLILGAVDHRIRRGHPCESCRRELKGDHRNGYTLDNRRCNIRVLSSYRNRKNVYPYESISTSECDMSNAWDVLSDKV
jgi:hypothetical protein